MRFEYIRCRVTAAHHAQSSRRCLVAHQHMIARIVVVVGGGRCLHFGCVALAFDFDIVLLAVFVDFDAFLRQRFMLGRDHLFQLLFGVGQLWQHVFDSSLAQHTANQTETFAALVDGFESVYHGSAMSE